MGTYLDTLVADVFLFCYGRADQADVVEAFNSTPRYLEYRLKIDMPYSEQMMSDIIKGVTVCQYLP